MQDYCSILQEIKKIAVVGISDKPERDSGRVAAILKDKNYEVTGVHPKLEEVFGITVYNSVEDIPGSIDLVDIFLSGDKLPAIIPGIIEKKPKYVWFQPGVINDEAAETLRNEGIHVIQDHCIAIELKKCGM